MTIYAQTNEKGYIVSTTEEELLVGLFSSSQNARVITEHERAVFQEMNKRGEPVHISKLQGLAAKVSASNN